LANKRILVTGATGWLGRETISLLQGLMPRSLVTNVLLASSKDGTVLVNGQTLPTHNLFDIDASQKFDIIIHLAFITQDRMLNIGKDAYRKINLQITDFVLKISETSEAQHIFLASSGVVDPKVIESLGSDSKKTYAYLKLDSEERFQLHVEQSKALLQIGRIWTVSGEFIQDPNKYAIGNFIIQARKSGLVRLTNNSDVHRTYIDSGELMSVYLVNLLEGNAGVLDSGGFETSISNLAQVVIDEICPSGKVLRAASDQMQPSDIYLPNAKPFNDLASRIGVSLSDIPRQVRTTSRAKVLQF
jgi:UDP-glucuronate decarboxylase